MLKTINVHDLLFYIFAFFNFIYLIKIVFAQENHFEEDETKVTYPDSG